MKKYLAVFDGYKFSKTTLHYAVQLAKLNEAHLVGVFLDEFIYYTYDWNKIYKTYENPEEIIKKLDAKDQTKRDEAVNLFQQACGKAKINFSVHRDKKIALQELKHESMFADLIMITKNETFTRYKEKIPTRFIKNLLADVQCPVLVVPGSFKLIDKIILLYDGRPSSLYALKMFSYLADNLKQLPVEIFTVNDYFPATLRLPDNKLMREFIKRHFPNATFTVVKGGAEEQILGYLRNHKENELVVLGAYQRSDLSRLFKKSMADRLMQELDVPLFVAHSR
ncbi:MAG: universal stress protein [Chitinophagaceae bacterium]|nr:universal stress protein [Chitinophagaceae bacterium]